MTTDNKLDFLPNLKKIEDISFQNIVFDFKKAQQAKNVNEEFKPFYDAFIENKSKYHNDEINGVIYLEKNLSIVEKIKKFYIFNTQLSCLPKKIYSRPRIAFLGKFKNLSLTDQRDLSGALGFETFEDIPSKSKTGILLEKWNTIINNYTQIIVIGDFYDESIKDSLYKKIKINKNISKPIIEKHKLPIIMESEIIKIHPDYPNINKSTRWKHISID